MAATYLSSLLAIYRRQEEALTVGFQALSDAISRILFRHADAEGVIPTSDTFEIQEAAGRLIQNFFTGTPAGGERAPFTIMMDGTVFPLAPYPRILYRSITDGMTLAVSQHAAIIEDNLPPEFIAQARATGPVFEMLNTNDASIVSEVNPFAQYDPPHLWVDPNGYRLDARIWNTSNASRRRMHLFLEEGIRDGRGAASLSKDLEQFLLPGRSLRRTNKPYGTDLSADAMRLARTETSRAHAAASELSASENPYVDTMSIVLSRSHPKADICDDAAAASPFPKDDIPFQYQIPLHPHCVLPGQMVATEGGPVAIEDIQEGDRVLTHKGRYKPVLAAWSNSFEGVVYKFETASGTFELTGNHPVLLRSGWVKAEEVEIGQDVLYAVPSPSADLGLTIAKHVPALASQPSVAPPIMLDVLGSGVPSRAVAFNSDFDGGQGDINKIATNTVFAFVLDTPLIKRILHGRFELGGICSSSVGASLKHWQKSGIINPLDLSYLLRYFGAPGRIIIAGVVNRFHRFSHLVRSGFASLPVVLFPTGGYRIAHVAHGNAAQCQQLPQHAIVKPPRNINIRARKPLLDIKTLHKFSDGDAVLFLEAQGSPFNDGQSVVLDMARGGAGHSYTTNGACKHDNLLSLSPDDEVGHRSGYPLVDEVITPTQALLNYNTITRIHTRQYTGNVYNMTVADDNSYTVNGATVHNCLCHYSYGLIEDADMLTDRLQERVRRAREPLAAAIGPLFVEAFVQRLLGQLEGGFMQSGIPEFVGGGELL